MMRWCPEVIVVDRSIFPLVLFVDLLPFSLPPYSPVTVVSPHREQQSVWLHNTWPPPSTSLSGRAGLLLDLPPPPLPLPLPSVCLLLVNSIHSFSGAQMDVSCGCPDMLCRGTYLVIVMVVWSVLNWRGERKGMTHAAMLLMSLQKIFERETLYIYTDITSLIVLI